MDAFSLITADHRKVETLFVKYRATPPDDAARKRIVRDITRELSRHAAAEEEVMYPELRNLFDDSFMVADAIADHAAVRNCLADLESLDWRSAEYEATMKRLMDGVTDHVEEEERELLPALRRGFTPTALKEMGVLMSKVKNKAPTHPPTTAKSPSLLLSDAANAAVRTARKAIGAAATVLTPAGSRAKKTSKRRGPLKRATRRVAKNRRTSARAKSRRRGAKAVSAKVAGARRARLKARSR